MNSSIRVFFKRTLILLGASLIASLTCMRTALAQSDSSATEPIKIGLVNSMTGLGATAGQQMVKGFNLYLDESNHKFAGRAVNVLLEDDESSPSKAVAKTRKLIEQDHADLICGIYFSTAAYAVAPVADKAHIPCSIAISGADDLTQRQVKHWVLRTSFTASQCTHPLGEYAAKVLRYKKIVTLGVDYGYGHESVDGFQTTFEANGGKIIQKLWISLDSKDFQPVIKQMRKDADAVFVSTSGRSAEIFPKQYKQLGPHLPLLGSLTSFDESFLPQVGGDLVGGISAGIYSTVLDTPANKQFRKHFLDKYGEEPGLYGECGYTCAMWIKKAAEACKGHTQDRDKLMTALRKVELTDAPRGPVKLDSYGNPIENVYIRKVESVGGNFQNSVIFTYPHVSQFWKTPATAYLANPPYSKEYPPCTNCELR